MVRKKNRQPHQNEEIADLFIDMKNLKIPDFMGVLPPPIKTWKEIQSEAESARQKQMEERKKRYESILTERMDFVTDAEFMSRDDDAPQEAEIKTPLDIIREAMETYKNVAKPTEPISEEVGSLSAYDRLYTRREKIGWTRAVLTEFGKANKMLERFMDNRNMPRVANASKRISKAENINLRLKRYDAEEIKKRLESGEVDVFGYYNLVPHTLVKTSETAVERKRRLMNRFHNLMFDFNYADRPGQCERVKEYEDSTKIEKRLEEITALLAEYEKEISQTSRKRKIVEEVAEQPAKRVDISTSKTDESAMPDEPIVAGEDVSNDKAENAKIEARKQAELEAKRKNYEIKKKHDEEMRKRRLKVEEREREQKEIAIRMAEELKRKKEVELIEQERLKEERRILEEEEKRKQEEEFQQVQEAMNAKFLEEEKRLEEEKARKEAEELEEMRRNIAVMQEGVERETIASEPSAPPTSSPNDPVEAIPLPERPWNLYRVSMPADWEQRKDKFHTRFAIPPLVEQRQLELYESISKLNENEGPMIISAENNKTTVIKLLLLPKRKEQILPENPPAADMEIKSMLDILKDMLQTRKPLAAKLSLKEQEVDYMKTNVQSLRKAISYPFHNSDGMYWPVFYALPNVLRDPTREHVEAYTKCNSFSGKYASYLLLTTGLTEDEDQEKKFDDLYQDSDGDWAEYSRKPGRFSNRIGYKATGECTEDFEVQKERAIAANKKDFEREIQDMDEFERHHEKFLEDNDNAQYEPHLKTHLRQLIRDARIDMYSIKETFEGYSGFIDHPGTRDKSLEPRWHTHGYNRYIKTRDDAFADHMYDVTKEYEYQLPPVHEKKEFEEWCLTPMLASLYYQAYYDTFHVFSKEEMGKLEERRRVYLSVLGGRHFDLKRAESVCSMTELDKKQWTFLLDQLVAHFRDFPAVCQLMFVNDSELMESTNRAIKDMMSTTHKTHSNLWFLNTE